MMITDKDTIFQYYTPKDLRAINPSNYSHFGWEEDLAWGVLSDAYRNTGQCIYNVMQQSYGRFSIIDSLVYPLFFNYRHSIELYLKHLYLKYAEGGGKDKEQFLNQGHNLENLWKSFKPILSKAKKKYTITPSIGAIEHYIKEIQKFDGNSMIMRYPTDKQLSPNKEECWLDYHNLYSKLENLIETLIIVDEALENILPDIQVPKDTTDRFTGRYSQYKDTLTELIKLLEAHLPTEKEETFKIFDKWEEIFSNPKPRELTAFLDDQPDDVVILVEALFYTGRDTKSVNWPKAPLKKQEQFINFCCKHMEDHHLKFGQKIKDRGEIGIYGKTEKTILDALKFALDILEN